MLIDNTFFGTTGTSLSSTSANHIANMAKELVRGHQQDLLGLHFTEKTVRVVGQTAGSVLQKGADEEALADVAVKLREIGQANSLIAWLREGIKAKNDYLEAVRKATLDDYCEIEGLDKESVKPQIPTLDQFLADHGFDEEPEEPVREESLTEDQVLSAMPDEDRLAFAKLQAEHAAITQAIDCVREQVELVRQASYGKTTVTDDGRQLVKTTPTVSEAGLGRTLEYLSAKRDGIGRSLLEFSSRIEAAIHADEQAKEQAYLASQAAYEQEYLHYQALKQEYDILYKEWNAKVKQLDNRLASYRISKAKEAGNLKIVIPAGLNDIYAKVAALGKQ